jgi:hypothetical protein
MVDLAKIKVGTKLVSKVKGKPVVWTVKDVKEYALTAKLGFRSHLTKANLWAFEEVKP